MFNLKKAPKYVIEIAFTVIVYAALCLFWYFFLGKYISISDQGLSVISVSLTGALAGLTAIIVSFTLIIWQFSRRERSESFLHWRQTLEQLDTVFRNNAVSLPGMMPELPDLLLAASRVSQTNPMPIAKIVKLFYGVEEKLQKEKYEQPEICKQVSNLLTAFLSYGTEHATSNMMYLRILNLRRLLYRLLIALTAGVTSVVLANTTTSLGISDAFNLPLAITLVAWFIYVLASLATEIKSISWLEDEIQKHRKEKMQEWQSM